MKKLIALLLILLLAASACASAAGSISSKDIAQPKAVAPRKESAGEAYAGLGMADVLSALKGDEITAYEAVGKTAEGDADMSGFGLSLHVLDPENPVYPVLEEIYAFTAGAPVCQYMGGDVLDAAMTLLPEGADPAGLVLDELYQLTVTGYENAFGDIVASFEFITEYPGDAVLLAVAGLLPAAEGEDKEDEAILWLPMQADAEEGRVSIRLPQPVLQAASAAEDAVAFALLRLEAFAETEKD